MKIFYPVTLSALLLLSACCTKKECASIVSGIKITGNADSEQLDSVYIYHYEQQTDFAQPKDSFLADSYPAKDGQSWYVNYTGGMNLLSDYKVSIPGAGRVFYISQLKMVQRTCNTCVFSKDSYEILDAYTVDGVVYPVDKSTADAGIVLHL